MSPPLISVVIPVRNGEAFLAGAVASIRQQPYRPLEILVVDDGSTDRSGEIARALSGEVRAFSQPPRGPAAARNHALAHACGEYIAFLDADDLWTPDRVPAQLEYLNAHRDVDVVFGLTQLVSITPRAGDSGELHRVPLAPPWAALTFGSALFRRDVLDRVGPLDESLQQGEDVDWCLRAREQGVVMRFLPRITLLYRIHTHNVTHDVVARDRGFLRALKQSLDRRRAVGGPLPELASLPDLDDWLAHGLPSHKHEL